MRYRCAMCKRQFECTGATCFKNAVPLKRMRSATCIFDCGGNSCVDRNGITAFFISSLVPVLSKPTSLCSCSSTGVSERDGVGIAKVPAHYRGDMAPVQHRRRLAGHQPYANRCLGNFDNQGGPAIVRAGQVPGQPALHLHRDANPFVMRADGR